MAMAFTELELLLLGHVRAAGYRPVKPRVIARQLGLPDAQRAEVRKAIKQLARQGEIAYGKNHLVMPLVPAAVQAKSADVVGIFRRAAGGFGFVRPRGVRDEGGRGRDIYIPARRAADASSGDLVRVRLRRPKTVGSEQRVRGEIVEVLQRETHQFVGTYKPRGDLPLVQVDGNVFAQPIPVGDPGAKGARPQDKVVIEMVRFPSQLHQGEAVIVEVLGARGEPGVDTRSVMREFGLPEAFPDDVLESGRQQAEAFDPADLHGRKDLTRLTVITIDPADARDFDDAISLERAENGHWRLGVHIADVAHFVPPHSPLDREAHARGTSVYLPDRVIPMLPESISNNLASLQPKKVRFVRSVFLEFTPQAVCVDTEIVRSAIKSAHRFNYEEVQHLLDHPSAGKSKISGTVLKLVHDMHELAMLLRKRRFAHGSLELTLPEIKIDLDDNGNVRGAHVVENTESHQVIEEFMLAANEAVAEKLTEQDLLFLRRIHAPPSPAKLRDLTQFVREVGIACGDLTSRFEIQRVLDQVVGRPEAHAVSYAVLRSMQKAIYAPELERHFALNKTHYCHFTSPIRRYPDLTVHRLLEQLDQGKRPRNDLGELQVLGEHCSSREQHAAEAERELTKLKLLNFLAGRIGMQMQAVITGVEEYGLFAQGVDLPADGLIPASSLQEDHYAFDAASHSLVGRRQGNRFRLGDLVNVEVFRVDPDRRELDFRLVARTGRTGDGAPAAGNVRSVSREGRRKARSGRDSGRRRRRSG